MNTVKSRFEFFVARRYLRAKRKQAVISLITVISVVGVAAGVMALVVALAINNGFRNTLQKSLLGAYAHVNVMEKEPGSGIENWSELSLLPGGAAGMGMSSRGGATQTRVLTAPATPPAIARIGGCR